MHPSQQVYITKKTYGVVCIELCDSLHVKYYTQKRSFLIEARLRLRLHMFLLDILILLEECLLLHWDLRKLVINLLILLYRLHNPSIS